LTETGTRLDPILGSVRSRLEARQTEKPLVSLRAEVGRNVGSDGDTIRGRERFVSALKEGPLSIIAECKRISPSLGPLSGESDLLERATNYAKGGASALSILTEEDHFGGSLEDLQRVEAANLPKLRKDFILDEYMVWEAAVAGADAILLLAVCLGDSQLSELRALAAELNLAVLLEAHNADELEHALAVEPDCVGVNARDLTTFEIDFKTVEKLLPQVDSRFVRVAESGVDSWEGLERAVAAKADAVLCGTALMRDSSLLSGWTSRIAEEGLGV